MDTYPSLVAHKDGDTMRHEVSQRDISSLGEEGVLIEVVWSSINYKDALSTWGLPGVTRSYPHTPGIDAAGVVAETHDRFIAGTPVIVTGWDLGMNTSGGYGKYIRVPSSWVIPAQTVESLRSYMVLGTAGLTAMLCLKKLEKVLEGPGTNLVVTGATGGVGSLAVQLAAARGFKVTAVTGKSECTDALKALGAEEVVSREEVSSFASRPLAKPRWDTAVDVAGGDMLSGILSQLSPDGAVAICGLTDKPAFQATVLPFILRGISILGVDSVEISKARKQASWEAALGLFSAEQYEPWVKQVALAEVPDTCQQLLQGKGQGRYIVSHTS